MWMVTISYLWHKSLQIFVTYVLYDVVNITLTQLSQLRATLLCYMSQLYFVYNLLIAVCMYRCVITFGLCGKYDVGHFQIRLANPCESWSI